MASQKKPSKPKGELPDWADKIKPAEDVMAMFYAPTGIPKSGPLTAALPAGFTTSAPAQITAKTIDNSEPVNAAPVEQPNPTQPSPTQPNPAQPSPAQPTPIKRAAVARVSGRTRAEKSQASSLKTRPTPATAPLKSPAGGRVDRVEPAAVAASAMPAEMFPGTSKRLYDALYQRTRSGGKAGEPVQATKRELMEWSGIRSKNTIALHLQHLCNVGLVVRHLNLGNPEGSRYEVRLPAEIDQIDQTIDPAQPDPAQPSPTQPNPTQPNSAQPSPTRPSPTQPNPAQPNPAQRLTDYLGLRALLGSYLPELAGDKLEGALAEIDEVLAAALRSAKE